MNLPEVLSQLYKTPHKPSLVCCFHFLLNLWVHILAHVKTLSRYCGWNSYCHASGNGESSYDWEAPTTFPVPGLVEGPFLPKLWGPPGRGLSTFLLWIFYWEMLPVHPGQPSPFKVTGEVGQTICAPPRSRPMQAEFLPRVQMCQSPLWYPPRLIRCTSDRRVVWGTGGVKTRAGTARQISDAK